MLTVAELAAADAPTELPSILAALTHDATDPNWACTPAPLAPPEDPLLRAIVDGYERAVVMRDNGTVVGFTTVADDGQLHWMLLDTTQFATLLAPLGTFIWQTYGLAAWGIVEGDNDRFATLRAHPSVTVDSETTNGDRFMAIVRWVP